MVDSDDPTPSPRSLVKYLAVTFFVREKNAEGKWVTGASDVMEVGVPHEIANDFGEVGRFIRDTHYGGNRETFVKVVGVENRGHDDAPSEPRVSLPGTPEEITGARFDDLLAEYGSGANSEREFVGGESVTLDWDNTKPRPDVVRKKLKQVGAPPGEYFWRASASGKGVHVRFNTPEGTTVYKVFDARRQYRDDLKRMFLDLKRYLARHDPHDAGGILFDRKGERLAGDWRRLRLGR